MYPKKTKITLLNRGKQQNYQKNKILIMKEKINLLDSNIKELYKIYSVTRKERVDKEKNQQNIINRINYLVDEEKKMRLKCEIQMKKIDMLTKRLSRRKTGESMKIKFGGGNKSFYIKNKNILNDSGVIEEEIKNNLSSDKINNGYNKSEETHSHKKKIKYEKSDIKRDYMDKMSTITSDKNKYIYKAKNKDLFKNRMRRKENIDLLDNGKNNNSVILKRPKKYNLDKVQKLQKQKSILKSSYRNMNTRKNKNLEENKKTNTIESSQKNKFKMIFQNKNMDLNSNKNKKSLTINYTEDKSKIKDNKQNQSYDLEVNKKNEIIKSINNTKEEPNNQDKSEFKGKRIVIIKKKERKRNNNDSISYKSNRNDKNELDKQKKNNITYDYIIDDDNIYYNDNKEYNENRNNENLYSQMKKDAHTIENDSYVYLKNEEKIKNIISNKSNVNTNPIRNSHSNKSRQKNEILQKTKKECDLAYRKSHSKKCIVCRHLHQLKVKKFKRK